MSMFSPQPQLRAPGDAEFLPLLFPLTPVEGLPQTPRTGIARAESSVSTQRRSVTPPGSVHTSDTPAHGLPPPILRLADDTMMEDVSGSRSRSGLTPSQPPPPFYLASALAPMGASAPSTSAAAIVSTSAAAQQYDLAPVPQPQYEDVWVTVYGFGEQDVAVVLGELSKCGDVTRWVFGAPSFANFMHVQFQNKWAAQRALNRNGYLITRTLMIGVKPLDPAHRSLTLQPDGSSGSQAATATAACGVMLAGGTRAPLDGFGAGMQAAQRLKLQPERPYLLDSGSAAGRQGVQMPQPARSSFARALEFVLGY